MTKEKAGQIRQNKRNAVEYKHHKERRKKGLENIKDQLIKTLTEALEIQKQTNELLLKQNAALQEKIDKMEVTIANQNETIEYLKRKIFGRTSEKTSAPDPNQMTIFDFFNEAEKEANPNEPEPTAEQFINYLRKKKGKGSRQDILKGLPVEEKICTLEGRKCPDCGAPLEVIGKKYDRQELLLIPAQLKLIKYYHEVYKCPACSEAEDGDIIIEPDISKALMQHSLASPSTVAYIMYRKYAMYEPLYRLEKEYAQLGAKISRGVMANWVIYNSLHYLKPIYELMHQEFLKRDIGHADEVPCQVLKEPGRKAQSKSYMWVYLTGNDGLPGIVLYDYRPGRSGNYAKEFLKGFKGYLHCDGYKGYNSIEDVERIGCLAHARRYFFEAIPKKAAADAKTAAQTGVAYYDRLFMIERAIKDLPPEEIKRQREEKEAPILEELFEWIKTLHPTSGSRLDKAVTYSINQKKSLYGYLKDGRLEASNNAAERRCKSYVMGRKNFLFHDQVDGAEASAIVYSLVETAKINGLNIYSYLYQVLMNMPGLIDSSKSIEKLLPWSEYMQKTCPKIEETKKEIRPVGMK